MNTRTTFLTLISVFLFCLLASVSSPGADALPPPTASTSRETSFEVTTVSRLNGCKLVLRRSTRTTPVLTAYWSQEVSVSDHPLMKMTWMPSFGERTLKVETDADYTVMQVNGSANGGYEVFLVYSSSDRKLIDVLVVSPAGWLRHGTQAEFTAGEAVLDHLRRAEQEIKAEDDKEIRKTWDDMKGALTKPK